MKSVKNSSSSMTLSLIPLLSLSILFTSPSVRASTSVVADGALINLVSVASGLCVDDAGASTANSNPMIQWNCNGQVNQQFTVKLQLDGSVELVNVTSGLCLDVPGLSVASGIPIEQYSCNGGANQKFMPVAVTGGYQFVAQHSGACLDLPENAKAPGILQQKTCGSPTQAFKISVLAAPPVKPPVATPALVNIVSAQSSLCLDIAGSVMAPGSPIAQATCSSQVAQKFAVTQNPDASLTFVNQQSGLCLDVTGNSGANGAGIEQWTCNGQANQKFLATALGNDVYTLQPQNSGICLDLPFGSFLPGSTLQQYFCWGGVNQKFKLLAASSEISYVPAGYDLVFNDKFQESQLDTNQWWTRLIYDGGYRVFLNDEQQRYGESNNHVMTGDALKLTAYRIPGQWERPSGMIRSKNTFKYGYFEARVKMPKQLGVWSGFWLNADAEPNGAVSWPPELDISEFINQGYPNSLMQTHLSAKDDGPQQASFIYADPNYDNSNVVWNAPFDFTNDYHIIAGLWDTDDTISVFIDGKLITKRNYKWVHDDGAVAPYAHVILNLAMGGSWAGKNGVDETADKEEFVVDYIRVYQKKGAHLMGRSTVGHDLCPATGC